MCPGDTEKPAGETQKTGRRAQMKEKARAYLVCGPSYNTVLLLCCLSTGTIPKAENHSLSGRPQKQGAECSGDASLQEDEHLFPVLLCFSAGMTRPGAGSELSLECHCQVPLLVLLWWLCFKGRRQAEVKLLQAVLCLSQLWILILSRSFIPTAARENCRDKSPLDGPEMCRGVT